MNGKVFAVLSAVQGCGAKYVATNLAFEMKKKNKDKNILLIDFDFENPYLAYEYVKKDEVHGVDNLVINAEGMTEELFKENITKTMLGVDVLKGTKVPEKQKSFTKDHIETIITFSKAIYDYIYIVVNNKSNNAGTVYGLLHSNKVVVVTQNNYTNLMRMERVLKMVNQYYRGQSPLLIVFNYVNPSAKSDVNSKFLEMNVTIIGTLEYEPKSIDNVNLEKRMTIFGNKSSDNIKNFVKINEELKKKQGGNK